jgi:acyl-CoA thioesterase FadM
MYLEEDLNLDISSFTAKGMGWYLVRSDITYLKPINKLARLKCSSFVDRLDGPNIYVKATVSSQADKIYAKAELNYITINLKDGKPTDCPDWMLKIFFED